MALSFTPTSRFQILALDSGGIKGIFSAAVLCRHQRRLEGVVDLFDLIAGTSTGGIVAVALGLGLLRRLMRYLRNVATSLTGSPIWVALAHGGH